MVFSSFQFILWFLPFCLVTYAVARRKLKNFVLLFFSIAFYTYGVLETPYYALIICDSVVVNWALGCLIGTNQKYKKAFLTTGLIWNFGLLFLFKYFDFFISNVNGLFGSHLPLRNYVLPLGISFFTFQIASYLIDVYRGTVKAERNPIDLATYIMLFPQLIAGPIVRFSDVQKELHHRRVTPQDLIEGFEIFIIGLGKKVLLANQLDGLWRDLDMVGFESISTRAAWLGIIAYSLQLYFDFWGYSQMAIGLGRMFGFHFPENFRHPYISTTMTEFWRRWHITLGTWFREYVYIPLGGNRKGKNRTYFNLFVVWTLTGIWHGADWNFVFWGMLLFTLIAIEKAGLGKYLNSHRVVGHLYMLFVIPISWLLFKISDLSQLGTYFGKLFGFGGEVLFPQDYSGYLSTYGKFLIVGILMSTPLPENLYKLLKKSKKQSYMTVRYALLLAIFGASAYCIYRGLNDPFLYFRF